MTWRAITEKALEPPMADRLQRHQDVLQMRRKAFDLVHQNCESFKKLKQFATVVSLKHVPSSGYSSNHGVHPGRQVTIRKATMPRKMAIVSLVTGLAFSGTAAAATPIYWPPARMAKTLTALQYPKGAQPIFKIGCQGTSKPRNGAFAAFRCTVTYYGQTRQVVFAKPLANGRVCGSTAGLKSCKPLTLGPLAGDPRVCNGQTSDACIAVNAQASAQAHWKQQTGYSQPAVRCNPQSQFVYTCVAGQPPGQTWTYTVTFTKGATAWATTVTP